MAWQMETADGGVLYKRLFTVFWIHLSKLYSNTQQVLYTDALKDFCGQDFGWFRQKY